VHFARVLRRAGLPIGPAKVIDALAAVQAVGLERRDDFRYALAAVLVKLIAASAAAIAAFGSAVFSWAGAAIVLEEAGIDTTAIWTAVGAITTFVSGQVAAMATVHSETVDPSSFPNGRWPDPTTAAYADGSVKDGKADWSLKN